MADVAAYVVKISDDQGNTFSTLDNAVNRSIGAVVEEQNGPGSFSFVLGMADPQALGISVWSHEVLVQRGGVNIFAGPVIGVRPDPPTATVRFDAAGLLAYFEQRAVDRGAGRTDLMGGAGDFEGAADGAALPSWTTVTDPTNTGIAAVTDTAQHVVGAKSALVTQPTPGANSYIRYDISIAGGSIGQLVTAKAWYRISSSGWGGPALEQWALVLRQSTTDAPNIEESWRDTNRITSDSPRDEWVRVEETISIKPSTTAAVQVRCYAPAGTIWWDGVALYEMESFSPGASTGGQDQATILLGLVQFLQGGHTDFIGIKSDLNIHSDGTSCPPSGVTRIASWQFADHVNALSALKTFCGLDDGLDIWVAVDAADATLRVFYAQERGTDRSATVTLTADVNCILGPVMIDGRQAANQVTQLWLGDGPDREETQAVDALAFGGVTLQQIVQPNGTPPLDSIQGSANKALAVAVDPVHYQVELIDPPTGTDLRPLLEVGDIVDSAYGDLKVVSRSVNPITDTVTVGLNVAP